MLYIDYQLFKNAYLLNFNFIFLIEIFMMFIILYNVFNQKNIQPNPGSLI